MEDRKNIAAACLELRVDGIIATNTTIQRPVELKSTSQKEEGPFCTMS